MSEHTPGPWEWWTSNSWRRLRWSERGVSKNVLMPFVCRDGQPDIEVTPGDMALIAAAPDLLAALQAVEAWWLEEGMHWFHGAPYAIFATREVIAKATAASCKGPAE